MCVGLRGKETWDHFPAHVQPWAHLVAKDSIDVNRNYTMLRHTDWTMQDSKLGTRDQKTSVCPTSQTKAHEHSGNAMANIAAELVEFWATGEVEVSPTHCI